MTKYTLTPKGEEYRNRLMNFWRREVKSNVLEPHKPRRTYMHIRRTNILESIKDGQSIEVNIANFSKRLLKYGGLHRSNSYRRAMHKEIADLLERGYIEKEEVQGNDNK